MPSKNIYPKLQRTGVVLEQSSLRKHNLGIIFRAVRDHGAISKAQLAQITKLTKSGVTNLVDELLKANVIMEGQIQPKNLRGRPGVLLSINPAAASIISIEINAFHTAVIATDLLGNEIYRERTSTEYNLTPEARINEIAPTLERAINAASGHTSRIYGLMIIVPGSINADFKVTSYALNWEKLEILKFVKKIIPKNIAVALDSIARLSGIAEHQFLTLNDNTPEQLLHLELGATAGIALIQHGNILLGANSLMGAIAHMSINPQGKLCRCGRIGCSETEISLKPLIEATCPELLSQWGKDSGYHLSEIFRRAELGEQKVISGIDTIAESIAVTLAALITLLDPDKVILGGYPVYLKKWLLPRLLNHLSHRILNTSDLGICTSPLDLDAALIGGIIIFQNEIFSDPFSIFIEQSSE
jgi:predicted NBD/HSP70 family sugar kinase